MQVTYYQELDVDHDWATYVYPLATTTRNRTSTSGRRASSRLTLEAKSEIPIVAMESPSHPKDFAIAKHTRGVLAGQPGERAAATWASDVVLAYHLSRAEDRGST